MLNRFWIFFQAFDGKACKASWRNVLRFFFFFPTNSWNNSDLKKCGIVRGFKCLTSSSSATRKFIIWASPSAERLWLNQGADSSNQSINLPMTPMQFSLLIYHISLHFPEFSVFLSRQGQIISKLRVGIHAVAKTSWLNGSGKYHHSTGVATQHNDSGKQVSHAVHYFDVERSVYESRRASAPSGPDLTKARTSSRIGLMGSEEFPFVFKLPER